ncbi:AraC family transcriptional regulator [Nocardiopsis eucommiae]|uniref:AraC family transcriptional regulator n=1 Tax=Nocardiopsis eucommiae TaxID=2831970 RepID=A0A975QKB2_9ACTN|nr:AraC family transcriptional regulator [Nocardiopsis eucommiae]
MMIESRFDTTDVTPEDRFDYWREAIEKTHAPISITSDHTEDFLGRQHLMMLDGILVWPTVFQPVVFERSAKQIRASDPECYHLSLVRSGRLEVDSQGKASDVRRQEISVVDTSRPFRIRSAWGLSKQVGIGIEIPKAALDLPVDEMDELIGRKMTARKGYGALLLGFVSQLSKDASCYGPHDGQRLAAVTRDLISGLFSQSLEADDGLSHETRENLLALRVEEFIRSRLGDARLTPQVVAQANSISTSYLHRIFRARGVTVNAWIREQRLAGARRDLMNPDLGSVLIYRVSQKWGFSSPAVFSRAYRDFYGVSPRETKEGVGAL